MIKITKFLGIAPRAGAELLPDTAAQTAYNVRLESGNLVAYRLVYTYEDIERTGGIGTLHVLRHPDTGVPVFLSWSGDISVVVASALDEEDQRFYYTGDGVPKVSNYTLATTGAKPYPVASYDLGLPLPTTKLTVEASAAASSTTASFARDATNTATVVTGTAHGLRTGSSVIISGFTFVLGTYSQSTTTITVDITAHGLTTGAQVYLYFSSGDAISSTFTVTVTNANQFTVVALNSLTTSGTVGLDIRSFNTSGSEVTRVNDTTFRYFSPGPAVTTTTSTAGAVSLGGNPQNRTYVYTWVTPWGEESIASEPSADLFIREGQTVTVTNIPSAKPSGNNQIRGVKLYRTLSSVSGTDYFLLRTLWFPNSTVEWSRTSNVTRVKTLYPHNLAEADCFKLTTIGEGAILAGDYVNANVTFTRASDKTYINSSGVLATATTDEWPVEYSPGVASFVEADGHVTAVIDKYTFEYEQVADNQAVTADTTGVLTIDVSQFPGTSTAIWWGNEHDYTFVDTYDSRYILQALPSDEFDAPPAGLQGLVLLQHGVLAGYVDNEIYFSEPGFPHAWPLGYKITLEHDILGMVVVGGSLVAVTVKFPYIVHVNDPAAGASLQKIDLEYACVSAKSIAVTQGSAVWATHDGLAIYSPVAGAKIITKAVFNDLTWASTLVSTSIVGTGYRDKYFASHSTGGFIFDPADKTFVTLATTFTTAEYDGVTGQMFYVVGTNGLVYEWDRAAQANQTYIWKSKVLKTPNMVNIGAARVIADFAGTITFRFYVDKTLKATVSVTSNAVFRLPTGYRSDTFEVEVEGTIRVREIHLAQTPMGLKSV